ncbi:hypothetical protein [Burkholderia anthina]|uniref:hypothetical protein n=1 Tax=Burkholderia anthina TaxID=179879 RepID=UPI00158A17DD|nr:hypothetical protein [Burkholderia anthina]
MKKVMIIGFSVVGNLTKLIDGTKIDNFTFSVRAMGGNHFNVLPYLIKRFLDEDQPDIVVLDLVSTPCRSWATPEAFERCLKWMTFFVGQAGKQLIFWNLFRNDVDEKTDHLLKATRRTALDCGFGLLDMYETLKTCNEDSDRIYWDGVHPSEYGMLFHQDSLVQYLTNAAHEVNRAKPIPIVQAAMPTSWGAKDLTTDFPMGKFERFGFHSETVDFYDEKKFSVSVPSRSSFYGVFFVTGPEAGTIEIEHSGKLQSVPVYDRWSYYARLVFSAFSGGVVSQGNVTFHQRPEIPEIALAKGEANNAKRRGSICYLLGSVEH